MMSPLEASELARLMTVDIASAHDLRGKGATLDFVPKPGGVEAVEVKGPEGDVLCRVSSLGDYYRYKLTVSKWYEELGQAGKDPYRKLRARPRSEVLSEKE